MTTYPIHTVDTAPGRSKALLEDLHAEIGMIPNLAAAMAESPELLHSFLSVRSILERGTFRPGELQVLALTNAVFNGCRYCTALHSTFAIDVGVSAEDVEAIRSGGEPADPRLAALSRLSASLLRARGRVSEAEMAAFLAVGYEKGQALEVVAQVAASIMPNYAHQLTGCPIDEPFSGQRWQPDDTGRPASVA